MLADENTGSVRRYLDQKSLTFDEGEEVGVELTAFSQHNLYRWELEITVAYGPVEHETIVIRADGTATGKPFETMAWNGVACYQGGAYKLRPDTGKLVKVG